ncbi:MAG: class I SAM-dependent methyltransferase [Deltaproteobacteria bacterium]
MTKLSSTSALVLLWAGKECYQSERAQNYLSRLELEEGRELYGQCRDIWPHYDEVIKNRKFGVFRLIEACCSDEVAGRQMVIVGAGLDALGIEVAERYPRVTVFELDQENMGLKSGLLAHPGGVSESKIHCIEADLLNSESVERGLTAAGWDVKKPTGLVLEGISYYLTTESIQSLVRLVKPQWAIFEFLKPDEDIASGRADIPRKVFGTIARQCRLPQIRRYHHSDVEEILNMAVVDRYSMMRLERMRTGSNRYFPTEASGWIEVCLLQNREDQYRRRV